MRCCATARTNMCGINEFCKAEATTGAFMVAGVIKSSLPRPCTVTVPESVIEAAGFCSAAQTEDSLVVAFCHPSDDLMVRIWEEECA